MMARLDAARKYLGLVGSPRGRHGAPTCFMIRVFGSMPGLRYVA